MRILEIEEGMKTEGLEPEATSRGRLPLHCAPLGAIDDQDLTPSREIREVQ